MALKKNIMNFITSWLASKTGQSLLLVTLILVFSACRRDEAKLDLSTKDQDFQIGSYFTDTITVKASTAYVKDSIVSSTSFLMCGAFADPVLGNLWSKAFTQIRLTRENIDYTGAVVNSVVLRLDYVYAYGDTLEDQTFDVYTLQSPLDINSTYYTISPAPSLSAGAVGSATLQVRPGTKNNYIDITLDNTFGDEVLAASNTNNDNFVNTIYGLAIVPRDQDKGAVIQVAFTSETKLMVNYTKDAQSLQEAYSINGNSARYFTSEFDRSGTVISSLDNSYDELSAVDGGGDVFLQSMSGLKVKISFPYIKDFLVQESLGNILINKATLYVPIKSSSNSILKEPSAMVMIMTDQNGQVLKQNNVTRFLQNDFAPATGTSNTQLIYTDAGRTAYSASFGSYFLANQLGQLPYQRALFASSLFNSSEINRAVIDASGIKLKVYYSIIQ
jgi:hypothetical protein